jgi:lipopolysaccharide export system permease protein
MNIIVRFISSEIIKYFSLVLVMVIGIYLAVDFLEKVDDFMEAGIGLSRMFTFFIYEIPFIISQIAPVALLLAVLIAFGLMSKNNEIIALKSSGVSIYYLMRPVLIIGILFSLGLGVLSEFIVPATRVKANHIWRQEVRREAAITSREKNIWVKGNRSILHIKYFNPADGTINGISLNRFDDDFRLVLRLDARQGWYENGLWRLKNIIRQEFRKDARQPLVKIAETLAEDLDIVPDDLSRVAKKSDEMGFGELYRYIRKVEAEGYDAVKYRTDLQGKIAFPLVCVIMCLAGIGLAVRGHTKGSLPISIAFGIGLAFLYWVFSSFCMSLGYGEMLPPWIAAWMANFLFLCFCSFLLVNAE